MKTKDLWIKRNECCGCELCAQTCPKHIIEMSPDEEGFLYPHILDDTDCINCNRCISVCPMKEPGRAPVQIKDSFCCFSASNMCWDFYPKRIHNDKNDACKVRNRR